MKGFFCILLLVLCCHPAQARHSQPENILLVGDCLSSAYGFEIEHSWVTLLSERLQKENLPYRVINISNTADSSSNSLEKLPSALKRYQPTLVIIAVGGNDGLRGAKISHIKTNIEQMVTLSQSAHAQVLLVSFLLPTNYGPIYRAKYHNMFTQIAMNYHLPKVVFFSNDDQEVNIMEEDNIHPTVEGQPIILNNVWPSLIPLLTTKNR